MTNHTDIIAAESIVQPSGLKISEGFKLLMRVDIPHWTWRQSKTYWKYGVTHEVYNWLIDHIGETASYAGYQLAGQGQWLHTGCVTRPELTAINKTLVCFWFREHSQALLFKLVWGGRV